MQYIEYLLLLLIVAWLIVMLKEGMMPVATTSGTDTEKFELKSLEGGYVVLRQLTYGEWLKRRQMSSGMSVKGAGKNFEGVMQLLNEKATMFEFANCVVEHNLEDEEGNLLDFKKSKTFQNLNPKVGEEISLYIAEMNQFDADEDEDTFPGAS